MSAIHRVVACVACAVLGPLAPAGAQESRPAGGAPSDARAPDAGMPDARPERRGWVVGGVVGLPNAGSGVEPLAFLVGVQGAWMAPGRPGADVALGVMPRALFEGAVVTTGRLGVTVGVPLGTDAMLLPAIGGSAVGLAGFGGGTANVGGYLGGSLVLLGEGRAALRMGATWHHLTGAGRGFWLFEIGLARAPRPRAAPR